MDITKIKIGGVDYDIKDVVARNNMLTEEAVKNIVRYGVKDISQYNAQELANLEQYGQADVSGLTEQQKQELEVAKKEWIGAVVETDPIFSASAAASITQQDLTRLQNISNFVTATVANEVLSLATI